MAIHNMDEMALLIELEHNQGMRLLPLVHPYLICT